MNAVQHLTATAASMAGVSHSRVFSSAKHPRACRVRFATWHVLYSTGKWSSTELAHAAGYSAHGTILHGLKRAQKLLESDPAFARLVRLLTNALPNYSNLEI